MREKINEKEAVEEILQIELMRQNISQIETRKPLKANIWRNEHNQIRPIT